MQRKAFNNSPLQSLRTKTAISSRHRKSTNSYDVDEAFEVFKSKVSVLLVRHILYNLWQTGLIVSWFLRFLLTILAAACAATSPLTFGPSLELDHQGPTKRIFIFIMRAANRLNCRLISTTFAPYLNCAISRKAILSRQTAEAECVSRNSFTENVAVSMQHVLGSQLSFNNPL
jgi:hypothetical protein